MHQIQPKEKKEVTNHREHILLTERGRRQLTSNAADGAEAVLPVKIDTQPQLTLFRALRPAALFVSRLPPHKGVPNRHRATENERRITLFMSGLLSNKRTSRVAGLLVALLVVVITPALMLLANTGRAYARQSHKASTSTSSLSSAAFGLSSSSSSASPSESSSMAASISPTSTASSSASSAHGQSTLNSTASLTPGPPIGGSASSTPSSTSSAYSTSPSSSAYTVVAGSVSPSASATSAYTSSPSSGQLASTGGPAVGVLALVVLAGGGALSYLVLKSSSAAGGRGNGPGS